MTLRSLRTFLAVNTLALLAVSGCKQEEKQIAPKDYAQELAFGYCEAVYSCACEDYPYDNFNACYSEVSVGYSEIANEAFAAGLSYDGSCPVKELERIEKLACSSSEAALPSGVCIPPCNAWHGPLPAGSFCEVVASSDEVGVGYSTCAQGLTCQAGVCLNPCQLGTELPGLGQPCPDFVCDVGGICNLETQICEAPPELPGPGELCANSLCDPERAICSLEANVCVTLPTVGQPCVMSQCDGNAYCGADDICLARPALACGLLSGGIPGGDGDGDPTGDGDGDPTGGGEGNEAACEAYEASLTSLPCWTPGVDPMLNCPSYADVTCDLSGYFECLSGVYSCVGGVLEADSALAQECAALAECTGTGDGDGDPTTGDGDGDPTGGETWPCGDGETIPVEYLCDGGADCSNNADEYVPCGEPAYICDDGLYIPDTWECDGVVDCANGEDEAFCR